MTNIQGIANALNSLEDRVDSHTLYLNKMKFGKERNNEVDGISEGEISLIENLIIDAAEDITGVKPKQEIWEKAHGYCSKNEDKKNEWTSQQIEYFKWMKHWFSLSRTYLNYLAGFQKEVFSESTIYKNHDERFTDSERQAVSRSLEAISKQLQELKFGQELIYNDLSDDIESLKNLMKFLSKKDWFQLFKGKLLDAGLGTLSGQAFEIILKTFSNQGIKRF